MPVENPNNKLKQKLDALTEVPEGFHFNPSAVWSKLEARLQTNNKRRNRFVSLYAAASVLFMIVSFLVYRNSSKHETIAPPVEAINNIEPEKSSSRPDLINKGLSTVSKYIEKKQEAKSKPGQQIIHTTAPVVNTAAPELITHQVENSFQNGSIVFKEKDKSEETSIAIVPAVPKMRFKIAHINELNRDPIPDDIVKQAEKINYGLLFRKEVSFANTDEKEQKPNYSLRKPKSFFSLINSQ